LKPSSIRPQKAEANVNACVSDVASSTNMLATIAKQFQKASNLLRSKGYSRGSNCGFHRARILI